MKATGDTSPDDETEILLPHKRELKQEKTELKKERTDTKQTSTEQKNASAQHVELGNTFVSTPLSLMHNYQKFLKHF